MDPSLHMFSLPSPLSTPNNSPLPSPQPSGSSSSHRSSGLVYPAINNMGLVNYPSAYYPDHPHMSQQQNPGTQATRFGHGLTLRPQRPTSMPSAPMPPSQVHGSLTNMSGGDRLRRASHLNSRNSSHLGYHQLVSDFQDVSLDEPGTAEREFPMFQDILNLVNE